MLYITFFISWQANVDIMEQMDETGSLLVPHIIYEEETFITYNPWQNQGTQEYLTIFTSPHA